MPALSPPHLTEDHISAALDGRSDQAVQSHLAGCAACAARLAAADAFEAQLGANLRRWDCPPAQQLAEYHIGGVSQEDDRAITRHVAVCASCRMELEQLREFLLDEVPAAPVPVPAAHPAPARSWLLGRALARTAGALRGAGAEPLMFEADGVTIFLDLQLPSAGGAVLRGQLVADDQERWTGARVELLADGRLWSSASVDDLGSWNCAAPALPAAQLRITPLDNQAVLLIDVALAS